MVKIAAGLHGSIEFASRHGSLTSSLAWIASKNFVADFPDTCFTFRQPSPPQAENHLLQALTTRPAPYSFSCSKSTSDCRAASDRQRVHMLRAKSKSSRATSVSEMTLSKLLDPSPSSTTAVAPATSTGESRQISLVTALGPSRGRLRKRIRPFPDFSEKL